MMSWAGVRRRVGNKGDLASLLRLIARVHSLHLNPCNCPKEEGFYFSFLS